MENNDHKIKNKVHSNFFWPACYLVICAALIAVIIVIGINITAREKAYVQMSSSLNEIVGSGYIANEKTVSLLRGSAPVAEDNDSSIVATYTSDTGITLKSQVKAWTAAKLEALYQELLNNVHGREIEYLKTIIIHKGSEQENVLGAQEAVNEKIFVYLLSSALPDDFSISLSATMTTIHLYKGDSRTTVESMARTLSHEYGHHFTNYYFFNGKTEEQLKHCEYVTTRGLDSRVYYDMSNYEHYFANHKWYLYEIAAEDYVQLMGSPTSQRLLDFKDIYECLQYEVDTGKDYTTMELADTGLNAMPQENIQLDLARNVNGLTELFYSQIGEQAPNYKSISDEAFSFSVDKKTSSFYLTTGMAYYTSYIIGFNMPYSNATSYTLIAYDENDNILRPVKTIFPNESASARVGKVAMQSGNYVYSYDDGLTSGKTRFRIIVTFEGGNVYISQPFEYDFSGGNS